MQVTAAQVKGLTKQRGITLCPQPRENALKVALIIQRRYKRRADSKPAPNIYFSNTLRERRNSYNSILFDRIVGNLLLIIKININNDFLCYLTTPNSIIITCK